MIDSSQYYDAERRYAEIFQHWEHNQKIKETAIQSFVEPSPKNAMMRVGFLVFLRHKSKQGNTLLLEEFLQYLVNQVNTSAKPKLFINDFKEMLHDYLNYPKTNQYYADLDIATKLKKTGVTSIQNPSYKRLMKLELYLWIRQFYSQELELIKKPKEY